MRVLRCLYLLVMTATAALSAAPTPGGDPDPGETAGADFRALAAYYQGYWLCEGHFANGTPITAVEQFDAWLNGTWLHELHDDQPPFPYHAHSVWGVTKASGFLTLTIYDNFGGVRSFTSADWKGASITFDATSTSGTAGRRERFIYLQHPPAAFSFEYQVSSDGGGWRMGDHVECKKRT
jgi:hypothetical protein